MKNLITLIGCTLILLAMFLQIAQNQITYNRLTAIDSGAETFKNRVSAEGQVTSKDVSWLKNYIVQNAECSAEDITVDGTSYPVKKGELIHYVVQVRLTGVLAAKDFWGFTEEENQRIYKLDRYVVSDKEKESEESNNNYSFNNPNGSFFGVSEGCKQS